MSDETEEAIKARNYLDYMRVTELLALQHPLSVIAEEPVHDEHLFVIMHQSKELWFLQMIKDLEAARDEIRGDHFDEASMYLVRCRRIVDVLLSSWEVLATLRPREFWRFRKFFGSASGLQSTQFRHIEFLLGLRYHVEHVRMIQEKQNRSQKAPNPAFFALLDAELDRPSLWDEVLMALRRKYAFEMPPGPREREGRWAERYAYPEPRSVDGEAEPRKLGDRNVENAWLRIFGNREKYPSGYRLGEALLDLASVLALWRRKHILTVQRFIGQLPGTGDTPGVPYLTDTLEWQVFPELWSVQDRFEEFETGEWTEASGGGQERR